MDNIQLKKQADKIEEIYNEYVAEMEKLFAEQDRLAVSSAIEKIKRANNQNYGK